MIKKRKPRILTLIDYYLPGYKAGGPLRTLANMVERLSDDYEFWVVTRDRDFGDKQPFADVRVGEWIDQGQAKVFYVPEAGWGVRKIRELLVETRYDMLYLNSFFSPWTTGLPLLLRRFGQLPPVPVVLAPRGEFSPGALSLKAVKKQVYIFVSKLLGLYRNLLWQASSKHEAHDIAQQNIVGAGKVLVAPNLLPKVEIAIHADLVTPRPSGPLRLVFISRISPNKNLDFLLRALQRVSSSVEFAIYGPPEDMEYWSACQELITRLPSNVKVCVGGQVPHEQIRNVFAQCDLFVFPTRGENFGHVIFEALSSGTPVLVSDQTPWQPDVQGALRALPLEERQWLDAIESWAGFSDAELLAKRRAALAYAKAYLENEEPPQQNRALFAEALGRNF